MAFYFIYQISQSPGSVVKKLQKIDRFETYKEAKNLVRKLRMENDESGQLYKIIFSDSELDAEEKLQEKREAPVMQEWEK